MNYLAQKCHKLWKACHTLSVSSSPLMMVGQRFDNFVLAWVELKFSKLATAVAWQDFVLALLLLLLWEWNYLIIRYMGGSPRASLGAAKWGIWYQDGEGSNAQDAMFKFKSEGFKCNHSSPPPSPSPISQNVYTGGDFGQIRLLGGN